MGDQAVKPDNTKSSSPAAAGTGPRAQSRPAAAATKQTFLEKLFSFLSDPDKDKKRLIRDIARQLKKQKQRYYNTNKELVLPGLPSFLLGIYRTVNAAKSLVGRAESSGVLKSIFIEAAFSDDQRRVVESLQEEKIRERIASTPPTAVAGQIKEDLAGLMASFDSETIKTINGDYNRLMAFLDLVHYDYYFVLRKFDSSLVEGNLKSNPRFEPLAGQYVSDDLKEIWDLILGLDLNTDWSRLLDTLKSYRDVEVVARNEWSAVVRQLTRMRRSRVLELIIKHVDKDPLFKPHPEVHRERIVDGYFQKLKTQAELTVQKLIRGQREERIAELASRVFGTASVSRLKNYAEKANIVYQKRMMSGFTHVTPLNYVTALLQDFFNKDVRQVVDLMLIKGQWSTHVMSNQLSEAFHGLLDISDRLAKFDESLGEEGDLAHRINTAMGLAEKDKKQLPVVRKLLHEINELARGMIVEAAQALVVTGKCLRALIEDYGKTPAELIINWKEIDGLAEQGFKPLMVGVYKKIYYFIQLLQHYVKK